MATHPEMNGKGSILKAILSDANGEMGLSELQIDRLSHELEKPSVLKGKS